MNSYIVNIHHLCWLTLHSIVIQQGGLCACMKKHILNIVIIKTGSVWATTMMNIRYLHRNSCLLTLNTSWKRPEYLFFGLTLLLCTLASLSGTWKLLIFSIKSACRTNYIICCLSHIMRLWEEFFLHVSHKSGIFLHIWSL